MHSAAPLTAVWRPQSPRWFLKWRPAPALFAVTAVQESVNECCRLAGESKQRGRLRGASGTATWSLFPDQTGIGADSQPRRELKPAQLLFLHHLLTALFRPLYYLIFQCMMSHTMATQQLAHRGRGKESWHLAAPGERRFSWGHWKSPRMVACPQGQSCLLHVAGLALNPAGP